MHVCVCVRVYVCVHVCVHACMHKACMYVCMYVYKHTYMYIYMHLCAYVCVCIMQKSRQTETGMVIDIKKDTGPREQNSDTQQSMASQLVQDACLYLHVRFRV